MPSSKIARFRLHLPNLVSLPGMSAPEVQISAGASCDYRAPRWLPGGHAQTIHAASWVKRPQVTYWRDRWETPDFDFIDLDWVEPPAGTAELKLDRKSTRLNSSH